MVVVALAVVRSLMKPPPFCKHQCEAIDNAGHLCNDARHRWGIGTAEERLSNRTGCVGHVKPHPFRVESTMKDKPSSVESLAYLVQREPQRLKESFPLLPKAAIDDLATITHLVNPNLNTWQAARIISSFIRHVAENGKPLTTSQFVEIVRQYAHAEDVPVFSELYDQAIRNASGSNTPLRTNETPQ